MKEQPTSGGISAARCMYNSSSAPVEIAHIILWYYIFKTKVLLYKHYFY